LQGHHGLLKFDKVFFAGVSLEECIAFRRVQVRDVNGDFSVLNLFGDVACSVDDRSHHEPTNNGPSA
jgi:hypothetical protein